MGFNVRERRKDGLGLCWLGTRVSTLAAKTKDFKVGIGIHSSGMAFCLNEQHESLDSIFCVNSYRHS